MSDLPDTPYCRVLPSGHEVHWWDKSGNECLCGVAVKAVGKPRGACPVCGRSFQLTKHGTMRHHLGDDRDGVWRLGCVGTGQKPVPSADRSPPQLAPSGCDECSVEPGEPHRYAACPGMARAGDPS